MGDVLAKPDAQAAFALAVRGVGVHGAEADIEHGGLVALHAAFDQLQGARSFLTATGQVIGAMHLERAFGAIDLAKILE